ncbi:hypothetical protein J4G33_05735 [Actinotalea sp. BY-33]|uniref:Lipoprotein n=1 Tax=Actinotalea soli TaxID=2819234 RepID=A0A939RUG5_9CELL|nr:hypothetical protein [Actinotalea soli]MBO1751300.1 hypothetical protein [Actinotalea soli]
MRSSTTGAALLCLALSGGLLLGCTPDQGPDDETPDPTPTPSPEPVRTAELSLPEKPAVVLDGPGADELAAATSTALYASAPVAVVAPAQDEDAQLRAASIAVGLGAPLLLADAEADGAGASPAQAEIERLGALAVVTVGEVPAEALGDIETVAAPAEDAELRSLLGWEAATDDEGAAAEDATEEKDPEDGAEDPTDGTEGVATVIALDREVRTLLGGEGGAEDGPTDDEPSPSAEPTTSEPTPEDPPGPEDSAPGGPLPPTELAEPTEGGVVLTTGEPAQVAAVATARAAGVPVVTVPDGDPRRESSVVQAMAEIAPSTVIGLSETFVGARTLAWKAETAATGVELPGGGQVLFPGRRMIAIYGTPGTPALGLLGEQDLDQSIRRVQDIAARYEPLTTGTVVPAFEIIVTVASAEPGEDGNYTRELPVESFVPWVEAAQEAGVYVVIDLQPGRTDFLTQAQRYEELLRYPNVGLALDPEWRLEPDQVHLRQIGSVEIDEVNQVVDYLADLTREEALPQKLLVLHQFRLSMIRDRERLDTSRDEVAVLIHADGQGSQPAKQDTWRALRAGAPEGVTWGWKNFIDEDTPTLTPTETFRDVQPTPRFVSYQ